jgi:hypothetical protein
VSVITLDHNFAACRIPEVHMSHNIEILIPEIHMVEIIEIVIRMDGETPAAFKARIAGVQLGAPTENLLDGAIGRATITPNGLHADMAWGQAHDELPADICVVAWWPLAAARGKFVAVAPDVLERALRRAQIASMYAAEMRKVYGGAHKGIPGSMHYAFADAILSKNAYALEHLGNGMNGVAKTAFTAATGVPLPKLQGATWKAIREWAGVSDAADAVVKAQHKVNVEARFLSSTHNVESTQAWIREQIQKGFTRLVNEPGKWLLANAAGAAWDLSKRGTNLAKARPLIEAELALAKAQAALAAEQGVQAHKATALAA